MSKIMEKILLDSKAEMVQKIMNNTGKTAREVMAIAEIPESEYGEIELRLKKEAAA